MSLSFLYTFAPEEITNGKIDVKNIKQLVCGKQVTAIVMNDGTAYMWGNHSSGATNMGQISKLDNIEKIAFTNEYAIALLKDGTYSVGSTTTFDYGYICKDGGSERINIQEFFAESGIKVVDIAATGGSAAFALEDGRVIISGITVNGENKLPVLAKDEKIIRVFGGQKHYTAITDKGNIYSWGSNVWDQATVPGGLDGTAEIFTGPFQNYAVDKDGKQVMLNATPGQGANRIQITDAYGRLSVADPSFNNHCANKKYVDDAIAQLKAELLGGN
jgi:peptide/nickel transport system permease protein